MAAGSSRAWTRVCAPLPGCRRARVGTPQKGRAGRATSAGGCSPGWRSHRATGKDEYGAAAAGLGARLLALQTTDFTAGSERSPRILAQFRERRHAVRRCRLLRDPGALRCWNWRRRCPNHRDAARWRDAVKMHLDGYVRPMSAHSPFEIVPYGIFTGSPTKEVYRPLAGDLTYRYFMPVRKQFWWLGTTSHLLGYGAPAGDGGARLPQRRVPPSRVPPTGVGDGRQSLQRVPDDGRGDAQSVSALALSSG